MDQDDKPTIDNMPDEVLVEIFSFLSPKLLKVSALVCNRWNDLIGITPELMKNFKLNLIPGDLKLPQGAAALTRRFCNIKLYLLGGMFLDILQMHNIRTLEITRAHIGKQQLTDALAKMENLESLTTTAVLFESESTGAVIEPVNLGKLKHLSITLSSVDIFRLLTTSTLETFELSTFSVTVTDNKEPIAELLMKQHALESLSFTGVDTHNILTEENIHKMPFNLKSFSRITSSTSEAVRLFPKLHNRTLENLILRCSPLKPDEVSVLPEFSKLKSLELPVNSINHALKPLPNVTSLSTAGFNCSPRSNKEFVRLFPALDTLHIECAAEKEFKDFLIHISEEYSGLIDLSILHLPPACSQQLKFKNLKIFSVRRIRDSACFDAFIKRHADTLEVLKIGWIDGAEFSRGVTVDAIKFCTKLKHISISSDSPIATRMFKNKISRNHPWTLESNFSKDSARIVFKFPDDEAVWQGRASTWDDTLIRSFKSSDNYGLNAFVNQFR